MQCNKFLLVFSISLFPSRMQFNLRKLAKHKLWYLLMLNFNSSNRNEFSLSFRFLWVCLIGASQSACFIVCWNDLKNVQGLKKMDRRKKCYKRSGASLFDCHKTCSIKTYVLGTSLDAKGGATAFSWIFFSSKNTWQAPLDFDNSYRMTWQKNYSWVKIHLHRWS